PLIIFVSLFLYHLLHFCSYPFFFFFFFNATATTEIYTLSLHDALPIYTLAVENHLSCYSAIESGQISDPIFSLEVFSNLPTFNRSEEHTSELQSPCNLVCRLLLEKKKKNKKNQTIHKQNVHKNNKIS